MICTLSVVFPSNQTCSLLISVEVPVKLHLNASGRNQESEVFEEERFPTGYVYIRLDA